MRPFPSHTTTIPSARFDRRTAFVVSTVVAAVSAAPLAWHSSHLTLSTLTSIFPG